MTVVTVRIEPNRAQSRVVWEVRGEDGAEARGFAASPGDAMRDAAAFVDAMMQPRLGGLWEKSKLRVVSND